MITRPSLTEKQKQSFEDQFQAIITDASPEIQKTWAFNPRIIWMPADIFAIPSGVQDLLKGKLYDRFFSLTLKIKNGTL